MNKSKLPDIFSNAHDFFDFISKTRREAVSDVEAIDYWVENTLDKETNQPNE